MDHAATQRESRTAGRRDLLVFCAVSAIAGAILYRFPSIDLFFAGLFHDPGNGFPAARDPDVQAIRKAFIWVGYVVFAGLLLSVSARHLWGRYLFGLTRRSICFIVVFSVLGPGLIVNHVFKDHWDRARPRAIVEFGGEKSFTPRRWPSRISANATAPSFPARRATASPMPRSRFSWRRAGGGGYSGRRSGSARSSGRSACWWARIS